MLTTCRLSKDLQLKFGGEVHVPNWNWTGRAPSGSLCPRSKRSQSRPGPRIRVIRCWSDCQTQFHRIVHPASVPHGIGSVCSCRLALHPSAPRLVSHRCARDRSVHSAWSTHRQIEVNTVIPPDVRVPNRGSTRDRVKTAAHVMQRNLKKV